jgi:N utilization substance protein B
VSVGRRKARREAVVVLYQGDLLGLTPRAALERAEGTEPVTDPYTRRLVLGVGEHIQAIDDVVSRHLAGWTLARLGSVERSILRIGAFELGWAPDVPTAVIVDEAVELAKRFASDEAGSLVNGVLAAVQGTLRMGEEYTPGP